MTSQLVIFRAFFFSLTLNIKKSGKSTNRKILALSALMFNRMLNKIYCFCLKGCVSLLEDKFLKNLVYIAGTAIAFAVIQVS